MSPLPLCLSVRQPWASAIVAGIKLVENRTWPPPDRVIGTRILIHAGNSFEDYAVDEFPELERFRTAPRGAIIGSVVVKRCTEKMPRNRFAYPGNLYWILEEPIAFRNPVSTPGKLKLWTVPEHLEQRVAAELRRG
jgi:hypothetical protein